MAQVGQHYLRQRRLYLRCLTACLHSTDTARADWGLGDTAQVHNSITTLSNTTKKSLCRLPKPLSPFLTGRMFVRPNILRTLRRTMIRFLIEHLVCRIRFGQSRLYFILNWLVLRCKLRPELAADAQQTA